MIPSHHHGGAVSYGVGPSFLSIAQIGAKGWSHPRGDVPILSIDPGSEAVAVCVPRSCGAVGGGVRRAITSFTERSAAAMRRCVERVDRRSAPVERWRFVVLTFQREDVSVGEGKRCFKLWRDWLRRAFPSVCGFWKVEPQERGTPHFHLLLHVPEGVDDQAVRVAMYERWHRVADPEGTHHHWWHLRDENWRPLKSWEQVLGYVAGYMSKPVDPRWNSPGRWWGKLNGSAIPRAPWLQAEVSRAAAVTVARWIRRYVEHRPCGWVTVEIDGKRQRVNRAWKLNGSSETVGQFIDRGVPHVPGRYRMRHWSSESMCRSVPSGIRDRIIERAMLLHPFDDVMRQSAGVDGLNQAFDELADRAAMRSRFLAAFRAGLIEARDKRAAAYAWLAMSPIERRMCWSGSPKVPRAAPSERTEAVSTVVHWVNR